MPASLLIAPAWRIAALALGAGLCVAAILLHTILRAAARSAPWSVARTASVVAGAVLMLWALASYLPPPARLAAASPAAHAAPGTVSARDLVGSAATALETCSLPAPPALPNGEQASLDEMAGARAAFEAYDTATNTYTQCVDTTIARTAKQFAGATTPSDLEALETFGARAHNAAIDREKAIAEQFNLQIRAYRARHPTR